MRFEHVTSYPAPADEVLAMLTDPAFRERVCQEQGALEHQVDVTGSGVGARVHIERTQSLDGAPPMVTRFVGQRARVIQREHWTGPTTAEFAMETPGRPGHMKGGIRLRQAAGGGCEEVFTGEMRVHVPLVGGKLESLVGRVLVLALVREGEVGRAWLAGAWG